MPNTGGLRRIAVVMLLATSIGATATRANAQSCVDDVTGETNNCKSEDVSITSIVVKSGGLIDGCTSTADTATVDLVVTVTASEPTRYDIGLYIALDGGDARTGICSHQFLGPALSPPGVLDLTGGDGPYRNLDGDGCGDIENGEDNVKDLGVLTIPCTDIDEDGFVDLGTVTSWDENGGGICNCLLYTSDAA